MISIHALIKLNFSNLVLFEFTVSARSHRAFSIILIVFVRLVYSLLVFPNSDKIVPSNRPRFHPP